MVTIGGGRHKVLFFWYRRYLYKLNTSTYNPKHFFFIFTDIGYMPHISAKLIEIIIIMVKTIFAVKYML